MEIKELNGSKSWNNNLKIILSCEQKPYFLSYVKKNLSSILYS